MVLFGHMSVIVKKVYFLHSIYVLYLSTISRRSNTKLSHSREKIKNHKQRIVVRLRAKQTLQSETFAKILAF